MELREINLPQEFSRIRALEWLKSHRRGDTGIGKTLEDMLGIPENNQGEPDCLFRGLPVEIKARRLRTSSMITLFTLEPGTRHLNDVELMRAYGYRDKHERTALKTTLSTSAYTPQGLKLVVDENLGTISVVDRNGKAPWIWTTSDIKLKLQNLCIVEAETTEREGSECFRLEKATLLSGLNEKDFFRLPSEGSVKVDLRMHMKPNGVSRNHGTAFRLSSYEDLAKCYSIVEKLL